MNFGNKIRPGNTEPDEALENEVLLHTAKYKITWADAWDIDPALKTYPREKLAGTVRSLLRQKLLVRGTLHIGKYYFALTEKALARISKPDALSGLLSEHAKQRAVAKFLLVCHHRNDLQFVEDAPNDVPTLKSLHGLPNGFARRRNMPQGLAFVRVESSVIARPSRSAQIIQGDILRFARHPVIRPIMQKPAFEYIWVTSTQKRANAVLERFQKYKRGGAARFTVVVIPQLLPLLVPIPIGMEVFNR